MSKRIFKPGKNTFGIIFSGIILVGVFVFISPFLYAHMNSLVLLGCSDRRDGCGSWNVSALLPDSLSALSESGAADTDASGI